jgi:hypothetical protein
MFISVKQFGRDMGVDERIARFFVDRKPPENNSFWKGKYIYIGYGNGYNSIPVYYDILYRIGVLMDVLLAESHVQFMERLMHFAILQEKNEISFDDELLHIRGLLAGRIQDPEYFGALNRYMDQSVLKPLGPFGTAFPSLNRADVFLYVLCDLPLEEKQWELAIKYWYALHPSYLIMDDIRDYAKDKENGDENVVIDLGGGARGFEKTMELFKKNMETLKEINPALAEFLMDSEEELNGFIPVNH